jgi:hypothetical protein
MMAVLMVEKKVPRMAGKLENHLAVSMAVQTADPMVALMAER